MKESLRSREMNQLSGKRDHLRDHRRQADPLIPHPNPKINNGFKAQLITTDANVAYIAIFGNPEERKTAFNPRYICVTTLPYRIIRI